MSGSRYALFPRAASAGLSTLLALAVIVALKAEKDRPGEAPSAETATSAEARKDASVDPAPAVRVAPVRLPPPEVVDEAAPAGQARRPSAPEERVEREAAVSGTSAAAQPSRTREPEPRDAPDRASDHESDRATVPASNQAPKTVEAEAPAPVTTAAGPEQPRTTAEPAARSSVGGSAPLPIHASTDKVEREGRVLLRLLEHGAGPTIDIAWPAERAEREQLYAQLERCFDMQVAVMDDGGRLFVASGVPGRARNIDLDRYSGFVRSPMGDAIRAEAARLTAIERFHSGGVVGRPVRLFPRRVDAQLLGGLATLLGERYRTAGHITARYRRDGGDVVVDAIRVDAVPVPGQVVLGASGPCR